MARFQFIFPSGFTFFARQQDVYREVYAEVGDILADNGIPLAQEIEGWSELCTIGEIYDAKKFTVTCVE